MQIGAESHGGGNAEAKDKGVEMEAQRGHNFDPSPPFPSSKRWWFLDCIKAADVGLGNKSPFCFFVANCSRKWSGIVTIELAYRSPWNHSTEDRHFASTC